MKKRPNQGLSQRVKGILRGPGEDFKVLNERGVQVSLSFLRSEEDMARVCGIISQVIQHYSLVPGSVQADPTSRRGVFSYQVKTFAMSPSTDSPEPRTLSPTEPEQELETHHVFKFRRGVALKSKFSGWKSRVINTHTDGFSERQIKEVLEVHPEYNTHQVLKSILLKKGDWKKFMTLYSIPKPLAMTAGAVIGLEGVGYLTYRAVKFFTSQPSYGQPTFSTTQKVVEQFTPLIADGTTRILPQTTNPTELVVAINTSSSSGAILKKLQQTNTLVESLTRAVERYIEMQQTGWLWAIRS